ncbi:TIGR04222 domain-containing membrane protein [Myxococcus sp. K15C18031901]|nr:TIGR04222 domain-containing membrane protein [Myxococcus dinghuensis]
MDAGWSGSDSHFHLFSLLAVLACEGVGRWLRYVLRLAPADLPGGPGALPRRPRPYEVAILSGPRTLVEVAVERLCRRGALSISSEGRLMIHAPVPDDAPFIERRVYDGIVNGANTRSALVLRAAPAIATLKRTLVQRGWVLDDAQARWARWSPAIPFAVLLAVVAGHLLRVQGCRAPPGQSVALLVFVFVLGSQQLLPVWRTVQGDKVFADLQAQQAVDDEAEGAPPRG